MNKPPAFQFYPKDFLSDVNVSVMNMEERGIYITLLSYCWLEGWLPIASTKLQRLCNNPLKWDESWENIKHCFYENGGKLYHKRLDEERKKQLEWKEKSRLGGLKSGESRRKSKGGSTKDEPRGNSSSSSSSSPTSSLKSKSNVLFDKDSIELEFDNLWKAWPSDRHGNKKTALRKYRTVRSKYPIDRINKAFHGNMDYLKDMKINENFNQKMKLLSTGLNEDNWKVNEDFKYKPRL